MSARRPRAGKAAESARSRARERLERAPWRRVTGASESVLRALPDGETSLGEFARVPDLEPVPAVPSEDNGTLTGRVIEYARSRPRGVTHADVNRAFGASAARLLAILGRTGRLARSGVAGEYRYTALPTPNPPVRRARGARAGRTISDEHGE